MRHWQGGTPLGETLGMPQYGLPPFSDLGTHVGPSVHSLLTYTKHPSVAPKVNTSIKTKWLVAPGISVTGQMA